MTVALNTALSGLKVAQQAMDVAATNISNASTPGYTRKILPQEVQTLDGQALGALALAIVRHVDSRLLSDINTQASLVEGSSIRQKYYDRIMGFHGASDAGRAMSIQMTALAQSFTQISAAPDNIALLTETVSTASQMARKINDFANMLTSMRSDTEADIASALADVNRALDAIARLNAKITGLASAGQTTAELEDQRDTAIKTVAKYIDITTFPSDNQIIVSTPRGQTLADTVAHPLFFQKSTVLPTTYYPGGGLNGITIDSPGGADITQQGLGGQLGALFDLRDRVLPQYTAQMDEFAQQLAERFDNEGLRLFTDLSGNVPASIPDPGLTLPYVGFSSLIKVNEAVLSDPTLLRSGTSGNAELVGSNEVIRRIAQFTFGATRYQQSTGAVDISAGALIPLLGLTTQNVVTGTTNVSTYSDFSAVPGVPGSFTVQIGAGAPQAIAVAPGDNAAAVVAAINLAFAGTVAGVNSQGQLYLVTSNNSFTIGNGTLGAAGLAALGFAAGAYPAPNPSFQVQIGTRTPVTISIAPLDTSVQLLTALNAVPGLTAVLNGAGRLVLTPSEGGDLKLVDSTGGPLAAMGMTTVNVAHAAFRQFNLGSDGSLSTGLFANSSLQDYISAIISSQSQDASINKTTQEQDASYLQTLETRSSNASGVNIDQEMSDLIRIQAAYTAAAKVINVEQKLFDTLLGAFI